MNKKEANILTGGLSKPSKMPGYAYNIPATRCKVGAKLVKVPGSVCHGCYALKGRYRFRNVKEALERRYQATMNNPNWIHGMVYLIQVSKKKEFRWHDSGDVQDLEHLQKIYKVCELTPGKRHWLPTREAWIKDHLEDKPDNLVIRFSAPMVNQRAPESWPNSSEVVSEGGNCPSSKQGNQCLDCRACWDPSIKTIQYKAH